MDNFHVSIQSRGKTHFETAISLFFNSAKKVVEYRICEEKGLILYWSHHDSANKLPYEMDLEDTINFVWGWLKKTTYPPPPDHDGDNEGGFLVYNEAWGHVGGHWQAFIAIKPIWAMYGK